MSNWNVNKATFSPEIKDLHWAAGFVEGEGSFQRQGTGVTVCQVNKAPLEFLLAMFGGSIGVKNQRNRQPAWQWSAWGERGRGIMLTLYGLLSPKRQTQIKEALRNG